jgi:hypothetical protein
MEFADSLVKNAIPKNDCASESQSGFGAIPGDEVIDGEGVGTLRSDRSEVLQNRGPGMIKIRQAQYILGRPALGYGLL